jgi:hypothetical protein
MSPLAGEQRLIWGSSGRSIISAAHTRKNALSPCLHLRYLAANRRLCALLPHSPTPLPSSRTRRLRSSSESADVGKRRILRSVRCVSVQFRRFELFASCLPQHLPSVIGVSAGVPDLLNTALDSEGWSQARFPAGDPQRKSRMNRHIFKSAPEHLSLTRPFRCGLTGKTVFNRVQRSRAGLPQTQASLTLKGRTPEKRPSAIFFFTSAIHCRMWRHVKLHTDERL